MLALTALWILFIKDPIPGAQGEALTFVEHLSCVVAVPSSLGAASPLVLREIKSFA